MKRRRPIQGVTFLAFGNGAPDIFGAIASVLSSPSPKAGLALGELLGQSILYSNPILNSLRCWNIRDHHG